SCARPKRHPASQGSAALRLRSVTPSSTAPSGGLGAGALHEIAAAREAETAAASGFALALATRRTSLRGAPSISGLPAIGSSCDARARNDVSAVSVLTPGRNVLWIAEDLSLAENGAPYGPGLDEIGI